MDVPQAKQLGPSTIVSGIESCCLSERNDQLEEYVVSRQIKDTSEADISVVCLGERNLLLH